MGEKLRLAMRVPGETMRRLKILAGYSGTSVTAEVVRLVDQAWREREASGDGREQVA